MLNAARVAVAPLTGGPVTVTGTVASKGLDARAAGVWTVTEAGAAGVTESGAPEAPSVPVAVTSLQPMRWRSSPWR